MRASIHLKLLKRESRDDGFVLDLLLNISPIERIFQ